MAQRRLAMQKIKDVLRMQPLGGVGSCRQLARAVGRGKSAVADCLRRAKVANLSDRAVVAEPDEVELSRRLYPVAIATVSRPSSLLLPDQTKVREKLAAPICAQNAAGSSVGIRGVEKGWNNVDFRFLRTARPSHAF